MCPTVLCDSSQMDQLDPLPNRAANCEMTTAMAVSRNLDAIAVGTMTRWGRRLGELLLLRPAAQGQVTRLTLPKLDGGAVVRDVDFSADGDFLVAVVHGLNAEAMVCCWDVDSATTKWTHLWPSRADGTPGMDFATVCCSQDGRTVAAATGRTGDVAVWDSGSGHMRYDFKTASSGTVAVNATGSHVAHLVKSSCHGPGQHVVIADIDTGHQAMFPVALSWVNGLAFAGKTGALAVVGERVGGTAAGVIHPDSTQAARMNLTSAIQPEPPQSLHPIWSDAGVRVAFGCQDGVMVWDIERDTVVATVAERDAGTTVALTACADRLVAASPAGVNVHTLPIGDGRGPSE